jgi:quercetin dioxygenase-like cupin family protein
VYTYHKFHHKRRDFVVFKNKNIEELSFLTPEYLAKNHGNKDIYVTKNSSSDADMGDEGKYKQMKLKDFVENHLDKSDYYFKTEDFYDFLEILGLKPKLNAIFSKAFPRNNLFHTSFSFWCGGKGTTTAWHTDMEDKTYLYVIKGKKKVRLASPKFNKNMYPKTKYYFASLWSQVDFLNPDYERFPLYKKVKIEEVVLNDGDAIHIPRHWWHCVENLEPTIAITYCTYTFPYVFNVMIPEMFRYIYYSAKGALT